MRYMNSPEVLQNAHLSCKTLNSYSLIHHEVKRIESDFFPVEHSSKVFLFMVSKILCLLIIKYLYMSISCWKILKEIWAETIQ